MSDKYQKAVEYLTQHPEEIPSAWESPGQHPAGCLFNYATRTPRAWPECPNEVGCLTMIRRSGLRESFGKNYRGLPWCAQTPELTEAIRNDERIPISSDLINVEHLPIFAEWQARLDRELLPPSKL